HYCEVTFRLIVVARSEDRALHSPAHHAVVVARSEDRALHSTSNHAVVGARSLDRALNSAFSTSYHLLRRGPRVGRRNNRSSDDDVGGARVDRFTRAHRPFLVVL